VYRLRLSGSGEVPSGAPHGNGEAIIAFHGDSIVCWRFAHLHGFTDATGARISVGTKGHAGNVVVGLSLGPGFRHRGCVSITPELSRMISTEPSHYYLDISSGQYPAGAVRAQL
jgi:hypothetical protein